MGTLQIFSQQPGAGKTTLAAALLVKLAQSDKHGAYYKPFSTGDDPNLEFIQQVLLAPSHWPAPPPTQPLPPDSGQSSSLPEAMGQSILSAVESLQQSTTGIILDGPDLETDSGLSPAAAARLAQMAGAKAIVLFRHSTGLTAAEMMQTVEPFGANLGGIIMTFVTKHRVEEAKNGVLAELRSSGIPVAGLIPESRILQSPTVRQMAETLGARWVQEPVNIDARVEQFLIGGNIMDSGPEYYGRYDNQAVIVRSQRPDIQLASLLAGTRCLVLTGGGDPTEYIKTEAMERDVPLMVVSSNTSDTVEALAPLAGQAHPRNLAKITEFARLLDRHLDVDSLLALLA
ncbi:MAG: AAA family ATPase [Chloroflexi bacterium]|nr:AAA family ATPase [Chloroflexota bacterium]